jgi:hypothetical protein
MKRQLEQPKREAAKEDAADTTLKRAFAFETHR